MMGEKIGGRRILERKKSVICLIRQGGRICKTKYQMYIDERKRGYKGGEEINCINSTFLERGGYEYE